MCQTKMTFIKTTCLFNTTKSSPGHQNVTGVFPKQLFGKGFRPKLGTFLSIVNRIIPSLIVGQI